MISFSTFLQAAISPLIVYLSYSHSNFVFAIGVFILGLLYSSLFIKNPKRVGFYPVVGFGLMFMVFAIYVSKAYIEAMKIPGHFMDDVWSVYLFPYGIGFLVMIGALYKWILGTREEELMIRFLQPTDAGTMLAITVAISQTFKSLQDSRQVKAFITYAGIGALSLAFLLYADSKATVGYGIEYVFSRGDYLAKVILQILPLLAFMFLGMFRWEQFNLMTLLAPFTVWIGVWELRGVSEIGNHMFIIGLFLLLFALGYYTGEMVFIKFLRRWFSRTPAMATNAGSVPVSDSQLNLNPTSPDMVVSGNGSNIQTNMPPTMKGSLEEVLSNMDSLLKAYKQAYSKKKVENPYAELRTGNEVLDRILDRFRKPRIAMYERKFLDDVINEFAGFDVL